MPWMAKWAGGFPVYLAEAHGARVVDIDGHEYADLCLGDTGAMAGHSPAPTVAAVRERLEVRGGVTVMLPDEDAAWVGGELAAPLRPPEMAVHAHGHGREPLRAALLPPAHGAQQGARVRLVLPRLGRRDVRDPRGRAPARAARAWSAPRSTPTETTAVVEFNDLDALERGARGRRDRLRAGRAGADEHRHRAARAGLLDGGARGVHAHRDTADHRRDAHALRRPGRLHRGLGPASRPRHGRQVDRRRRADRRLRRLGRRGGRAWPPTPRATTRTSAASAARWRATRCRSQPRGRRSRRC